MNVTEEQIGELECLAPHVRRGLVLSLRLLGHWVVLSVLFSSATLIHPPVILPHDLVMSQYTRTAEPLEDLIQYSPVGKDGANRIMEAQELELYINS